MLVESVDSAEMVSLVYSSRSTQAFDDTSLAGLLATSRRNNARLKVTGMLLYRDGRFLQVLEGPKSVVLDRMSLITQDPRHNNIRVLLHEPISDRQFPDWTMAYHTATEPTSDGIPGYRTTFTEVEDDDDDDPTETIRALRELIQWFQDRAIPLR